MNGSCPLIKQNVGKTDRIIRMLVGIIALLFARTAGVGFMQTLAYIIGFVGLFTAMVGYCGLYSILGITTDKKK